MGHTGDRTGVPQPIDPAVLGQSVLAAAAAAGIGVTVAFLDEASPRNAYVSVAAARIIGWPVDELLVGNPLAHVTAPDRARVEERWARRRGGEGGLSTYELTVLSKDGREVPIEVTASRAEIDGRPAIFTFLVDATARQDARRIKQENDARFRELVDSAPELIGIIRDGHFVFANRAYVAALGFETLEGLAAVPISTLVEPGDVEVQRERESAVVAGGMRQAPYVYRAKRLDGTPLLLEASSVPFHYEGRPSVLTMARDVTSKRQLERQLVQADRLAALGTLAAGVAHEINNPLAYVMLNLEWIARKLPDVQADASNLPALQAMLEEARQGAARVSTIVRELRSFARADSETRRRVDLATVVQSAIKIVGNEVRHRARVITSFEPTRAVLANEARLEQVVVNLLLNAAQAMPEVTTEKNEVRVTVREDADRHAVLEVHDSGAGIAPSIMPRIFDPFFSTKPVGVGTGLGLSICHGIVTSLGGQIRAYSEPGEGATFRIVLPTVDAAMESTPPPSEMPASQTPRARVLVIDDEPVIGNTLRELLAPLHEVVAVTSAREALDTLATDAFDVIFCDLMMPGMSGIDLFERLRAERRAMAERIVFMTGGAFTPRAAEFLASVPNRRMEKPFSLGLVERIVREMSAPDPAAAAP
jgi:PAS domain S-box-containing protein